MNRQQKILVITPIVPYPEAGAEQLDRAHGIRQLKRLGYDVRVVAKRAVYQHDSLVEQAEVQLGVPLRTVAYKYSNTSLNWKQKVKKSLLKILHPRLWDGAALEYAEPEMQAAVREELDVFKPDICWFDYTYLWPLYHLCEERDIPIITRSINYEPDHFLDEDGRTALNRLKSLPKRWSEQEVVRRSKHIFAITPKEEVIYRELGAATTTLPLRGLPECLVHQHEVRERSPLKVFFMGSTYNVAHNRAAAEVLIRSIIPVVNTMRPHEFEFHIFGKKLPDDLAQCVPDNVVYEGYQEDLMQSLSEMDIAIIPSLFGAGMQQKIFEPLTMGIPTLTSSRGIAGYPFKEGREVILCSSADEFAAGLVGIMDVSKRKSLSQHSKQLAQTLFSEEHIDSIVSHVIEDFISRPVATPTFESTRD